MYKDILNFIKILKNKNIIFWEEMNYIFNAILEFSKTNDNYYNNSSDYELLDFSYEYSWITEKLENTFRFSIFWTNIVFIKKIFIKFWYKKNLILFLEKYKNYLPFLKDNFLTCWFKFEDWKLVELRVYFDLNKTKNLLKYENINKQLELINSSILLKSFTFNINWLVDEKLYIPPDLNSFKYSSKLLKNNKEYMKFNNSNYYDILYRFKNSKLHSIKFYYNVRNDLFIKDIIFNKFKSTITKKDFWWLKIKDELGVDFHLNSWIIKYNYYIGLYKK